MSAFESYKAGRKAFAFDINPLTSFIIETISSQFCYSTFEFYANHIINAVKNCETYKKLFQYKKDYSDYVVHNVKWNSNQIYEVCIQSLDGKKRLCLLPSEEDYVAISGFDNIEINNRYPNKKFRKSISFSKSFLECIGDDYSCLYTKRNLWVLSEIFERILKIHNETIKRQLLYAFIQTVHLSTKMCVPRSKIANRDFSTSWGRSAFLYSKKQMEMNPLLLFVSSCFGKQSAGKALEYANKYFSKKPIIADITKHPFSQNEKIDIWYGVVDAKTIDKLIPPESIDFVLTDPPYGGLIQYLDLSTVWLSWLELYDKKYSPNFNEEITVNNDNTYEGFKTNFAIALNKINRVLKPNGKLVLTFNNSDLQTWSSFLSAITIAGFEIEKVIHQQNKRTGESNVTDPYGTSATDFYIRCRKSNNTILMEYSKKELEKLIVKKIIEIIEERKEPTPYQILFNGLLAILSSSKINISSFDMDLKSFMQNHLNNELIIYKNAINKAGNFWWINGRVFDEKSPYTLTNRVETYIIDLLNKKRTLTTAEITQMIFKKFPNGLTPDIECVYEILEKNATCIKNQWVRR